MMADRSSNGEAQDDGALDAVIAELDLAMPPLDPPSGLWARIADDLAPAPRGPRVRLAEGRWRTLSAGVQVKRLWGREGFLLRCEPGAVVPPHDHAAFEHATVIAGDLVSEGETFGPGDYLGTPAGGAHEAWTTRTGCIVLVAYAAA